MYCLAELSQKNEVAIIDVLNEMVIPEIQDRTNATDAIMVSFIKGLNYFAPQDYAEAYRNSILTRDFETYSGYSAIGECLHPIVKKLVEFWMQNQYD